MSERDGLSTDKHRPKGEGVMLGDMGMGLHDPSGSLADPAEAAGQSMPMDGGPPGSDPPGSPARPAAPGEPGPGLLPSWRADALADLRLHWAERYDIETTADGPWTARRRDGGEILTAPVAAELRALIRADDAKPRGGYGYNVASFISDFPDWHLEAGADGFGLRARRKGDRHVNGWVTGHSLDQLAANIRARGAA